MRYHECEELILGVMLVFGVRLKRNYEKVLG